MTEENVVTPEIVPKIVEKKPMTLQDLFLNAMKVKGKTISIGYGHNTSKCHKSKANTKAARKTARASRKRNRS
jgi:uncharacterized ParB-like nuclease family protein